jgi:hypothetical protein
MLSNTGRIGFRAILYAGLFGLTANAIASDLSASEVAAQGNRVMSLQPKIKDPDFRVREQAFDEITAPLRKNHGYGIIDPSLAADSTRHAVTELLSYEFGGDMPYSNVPRPVVTESVSQTGEHLASYAPALIQAAMELHDPGSIPLLYRPELLTTGGMATTALAYFGKTEAGHVVELYDHTQNGSYKESLKMVILSMLSQRTIEDPALLDRLDTKFLEQTYSPHASVRTMAAMALSYFPDAKARGPLAFMAAHDPWVDKSARDHKPIFSIRDTAALALRGPISQGPIQ